MLDILPNFDTFTNPLLKMEGPGHALFQKLYSDNINLYLAQKDAWIFVCNIICSKKQTERSLKKTVSFKEQMVSENKYPSSLLC